MHDLTGFQRDLLFVLSGLGTANGQQLKRELGRTLEGPVLSGRIYDNLETLVGGGYVSKDRRDGRTNEYRVTASGEEVIRGQLEWQRSYVDPELAAQR
jgi:DNA-binding PadR family transcriptional regulator